MNTDIGLRPGVQALGRLARILRVLIDQLDIYCRYIRAGSEIKALLHLSDQQLAEQGLKRTEVGRAILEKYGIERGPYQPFDDCPNR